MTTPFKFLFPSFALFIAIAGCSKSGGSSSGSKSSTWTVADTTYTSSSTSFTNNELLGIDSKVSPAPQIGIQFADTPAAGSYTVVNQYNTSVGTNQCSILETKGSGTLFVSTGGGSVTVTVSKGKITASFKNIEMGVLSGITNNGVFTFTDAGSSSGTLAEQ